MTGHLNFREHKDRLLLEITDVKHALARSQGSTKETVDAEERLRHLEELDKSLFPIIKLSAGETYEHTDDFRDTDEANQYFKNLSAAEEDDYKAISESLNTYFNQAEFRSKELDWMHIDAFVYMLYKHTKNSGDMEIIRKHDPLFHKVITKNSERLQIQILLATLWRVGKWILWIGLLLFCLIADSDGNGELLRITGIGLLIYKSTSVIRRARNTKRDIAALEGKLNLIEKAYRNLSSINYSKRLLINDLLQCRNNGIEVPDSVFSCIESPSNQPFGDKP